MTTLNQILWNNLATRDKSRRIQIQGKPGLHSSSYLKQTNKLQKI